MTDISVTIDDYDYELPDELIAQKPAAERSASRMLLVDRRRRSITDSIFTSFPAQLGAGDLLVLNDTKVFPARLNGRLETGAAIELFLIEETAENTWTALARPGRRLKPGKQVLFGNGLSAEVLTKGDDGRVSVRFASDGPLLDMIERFGTTPLPPYIKRESDTRSDRERYQTVYAARSGAIAAPTAGLHFTPDILERIAENGVGITQLTLHVGYGTFEPVRVDDLAQHKVMPERYEIGDETAALLNSARAAGGRIVAVGTTTTRALESNFARFGSFTAERGTADLTVTPGHDFKAVDALLTNFHLPKSSLLVLVSTFGGRELIMEAYRHAVGERYRFYSYGDCMFIS